MSRATYALTVLALVSAVLGSSRAVGPLLSGKVTDESGRPVKAASVTLESFDGTTRVALVTGSDGLYSFETIPEGSYSLSVREPGHVLAMYGPVAIVANRSNNLDVQLDRLPNDGRDLVTCDMSLVWGKVGGARPTLPSEMLFCMNGAKGKACTHLADTGSYSLYVLPGKYEVTLQAPPLAPLVSQVIDVTYCGEYRTKITLLE